MCVFSGGLCKHCAGVIDYINNHRDPTKTDVSCAFIEPSKANRILYPRGEEIEEIHEMPAKYRIPKHNFDMITDEKKEELAKLMSEAGVTESPLFYLMSKQFPDSEPKDDDLKLLDWVTEFVFKETNEDDIHFRVIRCSCNG